MNNNLSPIPASAAHIERLLQTATPSPEEKKRKIQELANVKREIRNRPLILTYLH